MSPPQSPLPKRISRRGWFRLGVYLAPCAVVGDACLVEPGWIRVENRRVGEGKIGRRFAHFTDVHFKGDIGRLENVVRLINEASVDFAVFTGDLIEDAEHAPAALNILRGIKAPLYGIPGNHDHWSRAGFAPFREAFSATGGRWLQDEAVDLPDAPVRIIGLDQLAGPTEARPGAFNLLLMHYPAWADSIAQRRPGRRFDLTLAGHTHGGQVRLPFVGALVTPFDTGTYDLGWFETPIGPLYVNPGIGTFYLDIRFNCRPEITLFEI